MHVLQCFLRSVTFKLDLCLFFLKALLYSRAGLCFGSITHSYLRPDCCT